MGQAALYPVTNRLSRQIDRRPEPQLSRRPITFAACSSSTRPLRSPSAACTGSRSPARQASTKYKEVSKQTFAKRLAWTKSNLERICQAGRNPLDHLPWLGEAGDPIQCVALFHELANAMEEGPGLCLLGPDRIRCKLFRPATLRLACARFAGGPTDEPYPIR